LMHAQADSLDPLAIDTWCRLSVAKEFGKVQHTVLAEGCIQPAAVAGDTQQQRTLLVGQQHQHAAVGEQGASAGKVVPVELDYSRAVLAVPRPVRRSRRRQAPGSRAGGVLVPADWDG